MLHTYMLFWSSLIYISLLNVQININPKANITESHSNIISIFIVVSEFMLYNASLC